MNHRLSSLFPAWDLFEQLQNEVHRPRTNDSGTEAWHDDNDAFVSMSLPGVDADAIDVTVDDDVLTVATSRASLTTDEDDRWLRRERPHGEFARKFQLPFPAETSGVEAEYERGVLRLRIPKAESAKPTKIAVGSAS